MEKKSGGASELSELLKSAWEIVASIDWSSPTLTSSLAVVLLACLIAYAVLLTLKQALELVAKIKEHSDGLGLNWFLSKDDKLRIRKRAQFCNVLKADLANIAKAENWNDQYFAELEAEVESEGAYYATALDKWRGKKSSGLRRVPSLTTALRTSADQTLLVVGDPGGGKSVAMRHLAHHLLEKTIKSHQVNAPIPLYINLKELPPIKEDEFTFDHIKQFVIDHVRRGDGDTAAYLKENWDRLKLEAGWVFIFDSFDEIPTVLHAPIGSSEIQKHATVVSKFLTGMIPCRGILASREYKGPDSLPWPKFRILPLSEDRQRRLINNSFLPDNNRDTVREHVLLSSSAIYRNPLFLSLLCRFVKDEGTAPTTDHDMLLRHIERLANREEDYIHRKYKITPAELIDGARTIAVLFAENPLMGLAPTQTEIVKNLLGTPIPTGNIENLLSALVEVKIGRVDVKEARAGDRRFTFSHRRYQESLFVQFLAQNPTHISARDLLVDSRWREYTVALLQSQDLSTLAGLLGDAEIQLSTFSDPATSRISFTHPTVGELIYYDKVDDFLRYLINILQEGLGQRLKDVPDSLKAAVYSAIHYRYELGDEVDRQRVLPSSGLLPQQKLIDLLHDSLVHGSSLAKKLCISNFPYLVQVPARLS
jgi:hypothetical protein